MTRKVCPVWLADRLFFLCAGIYIVALFGRLSYTSVMAELILTEGLTKSQAGLIGTALFIVYGVCQLLSGLLGDHIAPKKMITVGVVGSAILNLGMAAAGSYPMMLACWAVNGVFQALIWSPCARVFAEMLPPSNRVRACANAAATYPIATVLVYLTASLLLHRTNARALFVLSAVLMLIAAAFFWMRMSFYERETAMHGETEELLPPTEAQGGSLFKLFLVSGAIFALAAAVAQGLLRDGIQSWVPTFMTECFHFGASASVAMAIILPCLNILGVFFTRWLRKRYLRNELTGAGGFFIFAIAALGILFFVSDKSALLSLLLLTTASTAMVGANIMIINLLPIHFGTIGRASSVTGVLNCLAYVGSAVSSYGIGAVAEHLGWNAAILVWLGFCVIALAGTTMGARRWGRYRQDI